MEEQVELYNLIVAKSDSTHRRYEQLCTFFWSVNKDLVTLADTICD